MSLVPPARASPGGTRLPRACAMPSRSGGRRRPYSSSSATPAWTRLVARELSSRLSSALTVRACEAMRPAAEIDALVEPFLGGDDPVFGFVSGLALPQFFDAARWRAAPASCRLRGPGARGRLRAQRCRGRRHARLRRPGPLGGAEPFPARGGQQSRRGEPLAAGRPSVQTRVLRRLARVRPLEAPAHRPCGLHARHE